MMNINNINDWMLALAAAISNGDADAVSDLDNISEGWLQSDDERIAQQALIDAAYDVCYG